MLPPAQNQCRTHVCLAVADSRACIPQSNSLLLEGHGWAGGDPAWVGCLVHLLQASVVLVVCPAADVLVDRVAVLLL